MKEILRFISDLRALRRRCLEDMENETNTFNWGILRDTSAHLERAGAVLETAASVRLRAAGTTQEERILYAAVVLHRKPYPTKKPKIR